jgi:hypothetical protein
VTAPLTPPEPPRHPGATPLPSYPWAAGATVFPAPEPREPVSALKEARRGLVVFVLVAVAGVALGLLWLWLTPRVPLVSDGQAVYLKDTEGEEAIGSDGTFVLIALVLGALSAAAVFWRLRRGSVAVTLALAAGGALASVVGWRIGVWLGPTTHIVEHAKQVGPKVVFDAPLQLRAKSAIVAWPAAAMLVHTVLTYVFGERDEEHGVLVPAYPAPHGSAAAGAPGAAPQGTSPSQPGPAAGSAAPDLTKRPPDGEGPDGPDRGGSDGSDRPDGAGGSGGSGSD